MKIKSCQEIFFSKEEYSNHTLLEFNEVKHPVPPFKTKEKEFAMISVTAD